MHSATHYPKPYLSTNSRKQLKEQVNECYPRHSKHSPATPNRGFPPQCPHCHKQAQRNGIKPVEIITLFGVIKLPAQRLICPHCQKTSLRLKNSSLDNSGFSPNALERVVHLCAHQTFLEASETLNLFGWQVNDALLERIVSGFAQVAMNQVHLVLESQALQPLQVVKAERIEVRAKSV